MKMSVIKWDESMSKRCLAVFRNAEAMYGENNSGLQQRTTNDIQWENFRNALDKAMTN